MKDTMTISKREYKRLQAQAKAYQKLAGQIFQSVLTGSVSAVVEDFRNTNLYTEDFLTDLNNGLEKSSFAKR